MPSINNINSNFRQIAIADASDNVTGISVASTAGLLVGGGTSGQALAATGTGSATAWRTLPGTYGFSARALVGVTVAVATRSGAVVFGNTLWSSGTGYNATTGRYTVPVTGTYSVSVTTEISSSVNMSACQTFIYKNGAELYVTAQINGAIQVLNGSGTFVIPLVAGDIIDVRFVGFGTANISSGTQGQFSAYYLAP
jgi:hypothetical protein